MKQFIYFDTDVVNSLLAQIDKGLVLSETVEASNSTSKKTVKSGMLGAVAEAGGVIPFLGRLSGKLEAKGELSKENETSGALKELQSRTLHDAAFDIVQEYLHENCAFEEDNPDVGSFVEFEGLMDFVDFNYLSDLFCESGLFEYIKETQAVELKTKAHAELEKITNRDQRRAQEKQIEKVIQDTIKENSKQFDNLSPLINMVKSIIPYNRMLLSQKGHLIPLEDKYFRSNPEQMGFKFGGEIVCFGYITNVIGADCNANDDNVFGSLQSTINNTLLSILPTKEANLWIVHPIAVYHENLWGKSK